MSHLVAALVRAAVLGLALAVYSLLPFASEDALGKGLIAFAGVVVASVVWAFVDGLRHGLRTAVLWWAVVGVLLALGWWIVSAATSRDGSMSFTDLLSSDAGFLPFVLALVLVPAATGASFGSVLGRARRDR